MAPVRGARRPCSGGDNSKRSRSECSSRVSQETPAGRPEFRAAAVPQLLTADMVKGEMASESCEKKLGSVSHSRTETDRHSRLRQHVLFLPVKVSRLCCDPVTVSLAPCGQAHVGGLLGGRDSRGGGHLRRCLEFLREFCEEALDGASRAGCEGRQGRGQETRS